MASFKKHLQILMSSLILFTGISSALAANMESDLFPPTDYKEWKWQESQCHNCPIAIITNRDFLHTEEVTAFIRAIESNKTELLSLYNVDGQEYNLLAHMAIGILGRESTFFTGTRYKIKEAAPGLVRFLKTIKWLWSGGSASVNNNSRGPTQIKIIPKKIAEYYQITSEDLGIPENAARATMGFLIESLQELKRRVVINKLTEVTPATYADYLPYIYFGSSRKLINHTATPESNNYIVEMKRWMGEVVIYELPEEQAIPSVHP
jgi:hypothetical protein